LHFLGLSFAILLTQPVLGLDAFEQVAWARDPQWAYAKHPPLPAWILAAALWVSGNKPWTAAILGAAASGFALLAVWALARRMMDTSRALIAVFLLEGVIYFNFASVDFNHNVILLPLWTFIAYAAHRAYVEGKAMDWAIFGVAAALGMLGKYATGLLLVAVLLAFLADRQGRKRLWSTGPFIAVLCGATILAPHLWGLYQIDFAPFKYAAERLRTATSVADYLLFPLGWAAAQAVNAGPAICVACVFLWRQRNATQNPLPPQAPDTRLGRDLQFMVILFAAPLLIGVAIQAFGGVRFKDMWGFPMFVLLSVVIALLSTGRPLKQELLEKVAAASVAMLALSMTVIAAVSWGSPYVMHGGSRHQFPAQELAKQVGSRWATLFPSQPLRYVAADVWRGGMLAAYHPDHPSVLISGDFKLSPWITPASINESGAILIWGGDHEGDRLMERFPEAVRQDPIELPYQTEAVVPAARVNWAILLPSQLLAAATRGGAAGRLHID